MTMPRQATTGASHLLTLLLVALAIRAVVPAGWMPVVADHRLSFVLCNGWSGETPAPAPHGEHGEHAAHANVHAGSHHAPEPDEQQGQHSSESPAICAYAAIASALADPPAEPPADLFTGNGFAWQVALRPAPFSGLAAPPPPSTGPPALA
jgi:hypothetical protein